VPTREIMERGGWKSDKSLSKHYLRPSGVATAKATTTDPVDQVTPTGYQVTPTAESEDPDTTD
jgi:hypothetical protein